MTKLSDNFVILEITALDTTGGDAGGSPFAVPVGWRPQANAPITYEWTDGTSESRTISASTGQTYPAIGKVLKTPIRIMYQSTP
ncbi:hypothetical protein [Glutamicibacter uratoxydans]|uniref:hypothetical protein n=1 Tax=Glutamicibacter uratoxydans TaxID=43667 RepID=UPI001142B110|nr:hypothetical protein [Glutamicibacter uratoxydans]